MSMSVNTDDFPFAESFECLEEKFKHGVYTFRAPNIYQVEDFEGIGQDELKLFWRSGWVKVDGWPDPPERNPDKSLKLNVQSVKHTATATKVGG